METKTASEADGRYVRGCVRAYLEGQKDLAWIVSILGAGRKGVARAVTALNAIRSPVLPTRHAELISWIGRVQDADSGSGMSPPLERGILEWLEPRDSGFMRPAVAGADREAIDAAVNALRQAGYVNAAFINGAFGDNPDHWEPSTLTELGRARLKTLRAEG